MTLLYQNPRKWQYSAMVLTISPVRKKFTVAIPCGCGILRPSNQKGNKMTEFEKQCYGMSTADIREQYMKSFTAKHVGLEMVCMSILSDAQELLAMGATNDSRQYMNRAKFILCEIQDQRQAAALLADELTTE
jgi:hypothetical protein